MLRFEVLPLLQASQGQCRLVIASIRDILQPRSNPERYRETCEWLADYYHRVLIHGDARIARLDDSFPHAAEIEAKLHYSGYICAANAPEPPGDDGRDEVLVSAGGSATGQRLLHSALAAKPLSIYRDARWRLLVSPAIADAQLDALRQSADNETIVERNRPDFSQLLRRARLSISQAGYNTVTDILSSDTPAIVVPFADADEVEQGMRAQALQARGRVLALDEASLDARSLAQVIARVDEIDTGLQAKLDGADDSASTIAQWLDDSRQAP
jgi:predicted glycosyltransferase